MEDELLQYTDEGRKQQATVTAAFFLYSLSQSKLEKRKWSHNWNFSLNESKPGLMVYKYSTIPCLGEIYAQNPSGIIVRSE